MTFINPGVLRLATLDSSGVKINTYYLPPPNNGDGLTLEWIEKSITKELIDGSESTRRFGFIPKLTLNYSIYDDKNAIWGYTIGSANGNQLDFASLLSVLDSNPGFISISPSLTAGGFAVNSAKISPLGIVVGGFATGVSITFRGGTVLATKVLGAF